MAGGASGVAILRRRPPEEAGPSRARKTKRARLVECPEPPASQGGSNPSLFPDSDGTSGVNEEEEEEVVDVIARALEAYWATSPDAAVWFVRKITPATVVRCIDWEQWAAADSSEMPGSLLHDRELKIFLNVCVEEDALNNIPGNAPDSNECRNIGQEMREKTGEAFTQEQIRNEWDHAHRRFTNWCWLMGIDENTATVHAFRKGTKKYKHVLKFFENHRVFAGINVDGN